MTNSLLRDCDLVINVDRIEARSGAEVLNQDINTLNSVEFLSVISGNSSLNSIYMRKHDIKTKRSELNTKLDVVVNAMRECPKSKEFEGWWKTLLDSFYTLNRFHQWCDDKLR